MNLVHLQVLDGTVTVWCSYVPLLIVDLMVLRSADSRNL